VPLSDTAAAQSGGLLNAGSVLLVIDHRATRSAPPKIAAAELYNATLSFIAQRRCVRHLRCRIARRIRARQRRCLNRFALGAS
jgi:hypothetical protein